MPALARPSPAVTAACITLRGHCVCPPGGSPVIWAQPGCGRRAINERRNVIAHALVRVCAAILKLFFFFKLMNKTCRPFMHEIHLGPSDPRAFGSPSVSVTALVLISLKHETSLDSLFFFVIYV